MHGEENSIYVGGFEERSVKKTISAIDGSGGDLFVVGGPIIVVAFIGVITTVIGNSQTRVKVLVDPVEPGTNTDLCVQLDIVDDAAGTVLTISGDFSDALIATTLGVVEITPLYEYIVPAGVIEYANADNTESGVIDWYLRYKPMAPGVIVTAA